MVWSYHGRRQASETRLLQARFAQTGEASLIHQSLNRDYYRPPVPALTPNGRAIYYMYGIEGTPDGCHVLIAMRAGEEKHDLWRVPTDGTAPQKLMTRDGLRVPIPNIHPDGRRVAFTAGDRHGKEEVWVMQNFLPPLKAGR